ncbi:MAG: endonuclease/exonuclease/phosphatase family protein [Planctomycetaceae bacterium]|jgi:endonuclease/exonuclease/phosphatase family metal-dependent hydrolase|nr:endonuclease/exonuclease/phosphatase family protein [Planctomycetaceae bacterium]
MKRLLPLFFVLLSLSSVFAAEPIEVLSINVRLSVAKDGEDAWAKRRDAMIDVVKARNYDFIGGQEVITNPNDDVNQYKFMSEKLPNYGVLYRSREKTEGSGEGTPVFYRKDRWELDEKDRGIYWLSDTPDVPGSITWKGQSTCPRVVTGGLFHEKDKDGGKTGFCVYFYSTHFDHVGEIARQKAANMILNKIAERKNPANPAILVGDFNAGEKSPTIRFLKGETVELDGEEKKPPFALLDSYRVVHPNAEDVATFQGFKEHNPKNDKIDYIFITSNLKAVDAEIIHTKTPAGRFPSDHYPIRAVLNVQ